MTKQRHGIDGFIPRRADGARGSRDTHSLEEIEQASHPARPEVGIARKGLSPVKNDDLNASLREIELDDKSEDLGKKGKKRKKPQSKKRRIIKWSIIGVIAILLIVGGWLAYKLMNASDSVFEGNIFGLAKNQPLKEDKNGRSNILLLGTSEDDPGHGGAYLTDSMMIVSIHQKNKTIDMFSIPRDLYVQYGRACNSGYEGKINEFFNCVNDDWDTKNKSAEKERLTETRKFVGDIFDLDVQYAVHVNNTVIKEAVDAVGGVDVDIQGSNGDPGVYDRNFDWRCNYECYFVKYDNGVHHLDGEHALFLAMARGDVRPTYGLGNSNFDREKNQQKIIVSLKEKAVSTGTLTDITKITKLIDALGHNLRTNFDTSEIRTLMDVASETKSEDIKTISLFDGDSAVVTSGDYNGASVVMPSAGIFDYSQIRTFIAKKFTSDPVKREAANITVLNASGTEGVAAAEAEKLEAQGFTVSNVDNAEEGSYGDIEVYQVGKGMSATKQKLESIYGVTVKTDKPPVPVNGDTNFIVIFGKAPMTNE